MYRPMRVASLPRLLVVMGLLGLLGGGLLWLVPHFESWVGLDEPWTPPEPSEAGLPADPLQALQALAVHGDVPECQAQAEDDDEEESGVHEHRIVPVAPLERLKGQAEKIRPYLGHPSELVVYRAASLLCFIQDRPSRRALEWLDSHYSCRGWVIQITAGAGLHPDMDFMPRRKTTQPAQAVSCQEGKSGYGLLSSLPFDENKPSPEALALARRISEGEVSAVHQALRTTQAMDVARRADGGHALMQVSTPLGLALVYQAFLERWEAEVLSYTTVRGAPKQVWKEELLAGGIGWEALKTVAERTGKSPEEVLVATVGLMPEPLMESVYAAVKKNGAFPWGIARFARSPEGEKVTSVTARAFMERIEQEDARKRTQLLDDASTRITSLFRARDRAALKQAAFVPMPTPFQQKLAACYLLALGEDEQLALSVLERSLPMTVPDRNAIRSEVKKVLDGARPGATKKRLQRLYEQLSAHCQQEDCSVESLR